jgi:hypothetical protein
MRRAAPFFLALLASTAPPAPAALTNSMTVVGLPAGGQSADSDVVAAWDGNPILPGNLAAGANFVLLAGGYPFGGNVANLKDGLMVGGVSTPFVLDNTPNSAAFDNGTDPSRVKVLLDATYDLSRIDVFTSYQGDRTGQKWDVYTSANGGRTWSDTPLASVNQANVPSSGWNSRRVSVFDPAAAVIASGVNALRFDIHDTDTSAGGHGEAVFSEIALYGTPAAGPGPGVSVRTATHPLPGGTVLTDDAVRQSWGGEAVDPARNLAQDAAVTVPAGGMSFDSRAANLHDGRLVSEVAADDGRYSLENTANSAVPSAGSEVVFALDGARDIGKTEVFTAYQWTRAGQKYDIYTSTDGGASWSELTSVDYANENLHPGSGWMTRRVTVEGSSHVLAGGVNAVKFVFPGNDPVEGAFPESVYSEIAIYPAVEKWIYKDGRRFFPIGISNYPDGTSLKTVVSSSEEQIREVALAGVNWAWEHMNDARGEQLLDNEMLDRCGRHGISVSAVVFNWNPDHSWLTQTALHVPGSPFDLAVRDIMGNPHLLNYYGMDEAIMLVGINGWPRGHEPYYPVDYDTLMSGKRFLKSIDPGRFIMYIEGRADEAVASFGAGNTRRWVNNLTDVVGINYYPVREGHSFPESSLLLLPSLYLDHMARLVDPDPKAEGFTRYNPGRPIIGAWQGGPSSPTGPRPRLEEMRANVYSLIIHGAKGLSSWGEGFLDLSKPEDVECWNNYKRVSRELAYLQPVLVADDTAYSYWQATPPPYVPDWRLVQSGGLVFSKNSVIGLVKEYKGDRYLIAMNWGNEDLGEVSITVPGWKHAYNDNKTTVMFEDRSVDSASETWTDNFGPWEVHIYTDKPAGLKVEEPPGTKLSSIAPATDFGPVPTGAASAARLYTVSNAGSAPLTGLALQKRGAQAGDFTVTPPPEGSLAPGASTTFTVTFAPSDAGSRRAQLALADGSDADTPLFMVDLSGFGLAGDADSDGDTLSDAGEAALSALGFDWRSPQPVLVAALRDNAHRAGLFNRGRLEANRAAGRADVTGNPAAWGLYDSNAIMDLRMGAPTVTIDGAAATVVFQPQTTVDPAAQPFTDSAPPVTNVLSVPGDRGFFRIKAGRQNRRRTGGRA